MVNASGSGLGEDFFPGTGLSPSRFSSCDSHLGEARPGADEVP